MVRVTQKRKRSTTTSSRKRSRTSRRSGARFNAQVGQYGKATSNGFRSKRISRRQYRKFLWRDTLFKAHFRSIAAQSNVVSTPNDTVQATLSRSRAIFNGIDQFWTPAGGLTPIDAGAPVPIFGRTMVIRGGISRISLTNNGNDDSVKVKVWAVWAIPNPESVIATPATVPIEWDPSCSADFVQFGKVIMQREAVLLPGSRPFEVTCRLKIQKLDRDTFAGNQGSQLYWWYSIAQLNNADIGPLAETVTVIVSHNLSFAADEAD